MSEGDEFVQRLARFGHRLRDAGLSIGSGDVLNYCEAVAALDPSDLRDLYWGGRTTLVTRRDHIPIYDETFRQFFLQQPAPEDDTETEKTQLAQSSSAVLEVPDADPGGETEEPTETMLGLQGSTVEIWRDKSFSACTPEELTEVRRIMESIRLTPPLRKTRRRQPSTAKGQPDMRRMTRNMIRTRQEPLTLLRASRKSRRRPIVLILDVSGSMSDYSRNLLQFAYSTHRAGGRVEVFCFGTRLTRVTPALDRRNPDDAMALAAAQVTDWGGGTHIGEPINEFVRRWGRRGTSRGAIVVICSDGLDTGDPGILADSMERLSRVCHRIVWMNPHKGDDEDFQPSTLGMLVAAPYVDTIVSGHNLRSLGNFADDLQRLR